MRGMGRYGALDGWRGLCACMVAVYHLTAFSHVMLLPLVRHAYLFVDFFFVLSGFVIAGSYRRRLADGFGVRRFLFLRLGRIYPLHIMTMLLFIPIDSLKNGIGYPLLQAVFTNVLLLHGLGVNGETSLNFPSWSISAEFLAYVAFAVAASLSAEMLVAFILVCVTVCPILIYCFSPHGMNATFDLGAARCLCGFAWGIVCFEIHSRFDWTSWVRNRLTVHLVEFAVVALAVAFEISADEHDVSALAAPIVFSLVILVFAEEKGLLSRLLTTRPFLLLGTLSYSIYMIHALVRAFVRVAGFAIQHVTGVPAFTPIRVDGVTVDMLGRAPWQGDVAQVVMLAATIGIAALTYRFVEEPGRRWSRAIAARWTVAGTVAS